ncbi:MAG: hypothetical protein COC10_05365 [Sphingobium sp.]|nr:MAG: hypothetical protein COC10_05365 [Sphingobium sp.]
MIEKSLQSIGDASVTRHLRVNRVTPARPRRGTGVTSTRHKRAGTVMGKAIGSEAKGLFHAGG